MYGIIAAMQEEMKEIKKIMQNIENKEKEVNLWNYRFKT